MVKSKMLKLNNQILLHIFQLLPGHILMSTIKKNQLIIQTGYTNISQMLLFLKDYTNTQVDYLSDICGVDYPKEVFRFEIVYNLTSISFNSRFRIKTTVNELITLNSVSMLFLCASWFEREIWDMFGVYFFEHFRLRRILTDYGFAGYPLRKDFPVSGFLEVRYNEEVQKVTYEPVQFTATGRFLNNR